MTYLSVDGLRPVEPAPVDWYVWEAAAQCTPHSPFKVHDNLQHVWFSGKQTQHFFEDGNVVSLPPPGHENKEESVGATVT